VVTKKNHSRSSGWPGKPKTTEEEWRDTEVRRKKSGRTSVPGAIGHLFLYLRIRKREKRRERNDSQTYGGVKEERKEKKQKSSTSGQSNQLKEKKKRPYSSQVSIAGWQHQGKEEAEFGPT